MLEKITARVDTDALRYLLIEQHGRLERWSSPETFEGESVFTRIKDPEEIRVYNRLARAFNQLAAAYTEQCDDLPRMMVAMEGDKIKKVIRFWPENPFNLDTLKKPQ